MQSAWNPSLATGVGIVDREHQEIFQQAAILNQAMVDGKGRDELKKIVDFVDNYIKSHFADEEKVMDEYNCPVAQINRTAHAQFVKTFKELKNKFDASGANTTLVLEISSTINNWLIQHIKQIDSQLSKCKKTASLEPALAGR